MTRVLLLGALVGLLLAIAIAASDAGAAPAPSRLMVTGREFSLALSRPSVDRGPSLIQFVNRGEDPHDLVMQKVGSRHQTQFPEIRSGAIAELSPRLSPGRYRLWCSLPGHAARGMRASLSVRR